MARMLASVTGLDEAQIALRGGADIIDLKDPADGALGALSPEIVHEVVNTVGGRTPVSAVCGNLPMDAAAVRRAAETYAATGADFIKIGFLPEVDARSAVEAVADLSGRVKLVAVLFADLDPHLDLLPVLAANNFHAVMLDTARKGSGGLLRHFGPDRVAAFVGRAREAGLKVGLAGALEAPDIPRLLPFEPDFLGFRTALCAGGRSGAISEEAVRRIRSLIPQEGQVNGSAQADLRLLARGYTPGGDEASRSTDRIFVHDFVLPVEIGAYSFERGRTQKVRFDVDADVMRVTDNPQDMGDVVSYDLIMDGIRTIVARGHLDLVETLAEQIASHLLAVPRIVRVTVRVEKLEVAPGRVGVEIVRSRSARTVS